MAKKKGHSSKKHKPSSRKAIPTPVLSDGQIPTPVIPASELLSFSFKYLDCGHDKFTYGEKGVDYFGKVLERFKDLCSMKVMEIKNCYGNSKALRCHPIAWSGTTEPEGFSCLNDQLRQQEPYQFSISSNEHGRVAGFIVDSVFFIVWFDPDHALYA